MSKSYVISILVLFLFVVTSYSQEEDPYAYFTEKKEIQPRMVYPTIGIGSGMLSFYGDLNQKKLQNPGVGRLSHELQISKYIYPYLQVSFYTLFGKLSVNERLPENKRNVNFESQIKLGGLGVLYNFDHFLPKDRLITPYLSIGFESFEFLSKTDLYDKNGYKYNYWSDGTIRSKPETDPLAESAILLQRDYTYESDMRDINLDGFGKYKEQSFAIPLGMGFIMHLTDKCDLKIGTTIHHTFTDYIDGVTSNSIGNRQGDSKKDKFLMTSFSLNFLITTPDPDGLISGVSDAEMLAIDMGDTDLDGVTDFNDSCQGTPEGTPVDAKGCPFDDDGDGVPNYKDKELNSPADAFVNADGIQLTDSLLLLQYQVYVDSTGMFAKVEVRDDHGSSGLTRPKKFYTVQLGVFQNGISPELMTKFLSISDISTIFINDSTAIYTAGNFINYQDAEVRKNNFVSEGMADAKVVIKQGGKIYAVPGDLTTETLISDSLNQLKISNYQGIIDTSKSKNIPDSLNPDRNVIQENVDNATDFSEKAAEEDKQKNINSETGIVSPQQTNKESVVSNAADTTNKGVVFRVQLGAYSRKLTTSAVFPDIENIIEIREENGLYKYVTSAFNTIEEAAQYKIDLMTKGYNGIIAAYKDGKRVALGSVGAKLVNKKIKENIEEPQVPVSAINKNMVVFRVQVGVYKTEPPFDIQYKFKNIPNLEKEKTASGLIRYVAGNFKNYKAALVFKNEIVINNDIPDAFILGKFNNEYITLQEALELVK